jgi:hypothetical protein
LDGKKMFNRKRAIIGAALLVVAASAVGQSLSSRTENGQTVVEKLMPEGGPHPLQMPTPEQRVPVIRQLQRMQNDIHKPDAQQVAFLLAVLGVDYERNRDYLIWVLRGCSVPEVKHGCDDMTGEFLAYLYEHGHPEVLIPLMKYGNSYNAAGSEFVGGFLSEVVAKSPDSFLDAVRSFPVPTQKEICYFAGSADGGGMAPSDFQKARKALAAKKDDVAERCLREIKHANRPK